jgi:AraC family L-rhamnose operon regulatory protein RhaS
VTRPWQRHRVGLPNVTACTLGWFVLEVGALRPNQEWRWPSWLPLPAADLERLAALLRGHDRTVWRASSDLVRAAERLELTMREQPRHVHARLALRISEVILDLLDVVEGEEPELDPYLASTQRTVEMLLAGLRRRLAEPWTVDSMAAECGLGRTRFIHYCRQAVNATPMDYLNALRIERALELLRTTDASVSDIAFDCGFSSSQYFATVFRREYGCSPRDARAAASSAGGSAAPTPR